MPAEVIVTTGPFERLRFIQLESGTLLHFFSKAIQPPGVEHVLKAGKLAIRAVAEVSVHGDDGFDYVTQPGGIYGAEMEIEAAQRYSDFADAMEIHNNVEVAELFRRMATIEAGHAQAIMTQMGWRDPPAVASDPWLDAIEGPETPRGDDVHYLMQPWHALEIALASEERAEHFFARLADIASVALDRGICCHVDACMGGFLLPYFRRLGAPVPDFDFSVPGVTSMSMDFHKYAFAAKGASVIRQLTNVPGSALPSFTITTSKRPAGSRAAVSSRTVASS